MLWQFESPQLPYLVGLFCFFVPPPPPNFLPPPVSVCLRSYFVCKHFSSRRFFFLYLSLFVVVVVAFFSFNIYPHPPFLFCPVSCSLACVCRFLFYFICTSVSFCTCAFLCSVPPHFALRIFLLRPSTHPHNNKKKQNKTNKSKPTPRNTTLGGYCLSLLHSCFLPFLPPTPPTFSLSALLPPPAFLPTSCSCLFHIPVLIPSLTLTPTPTTLFSLSLAHPQSPPPPIVVPCLLASRLGKKMQTQRIYTNEIAKKKKKKQMRGKQQKNKTLALKKYGEKCRKKKRDSQKTGGKKRMKKRKWEKNNQKK